jgi:CBS domain-containing protein
MYVNMKVKDLMTANQSKYCRPETKLLQAAKIMETSNFGALPVVDKEKKVIGIITDRDICLSLAQKHATPFAKITVGQIMPTQVNTVNLNDDISVALREMRINQIGRLPVVDSHGKIKGIITLHQLINKAVGSGSELTGTLSGTGENILKTIYAVTNRYGGIVGLKSEPIAPQVHRIKIEEEYDDI